MVNRAIVSMTPKAVEKAMAVGTWEIRMASGPVMNMKRHVTVNVRVHSNWTTIGPIPALKSRVSRLEHRTWRSIEATSPNTGERTHIIIVKGSLPQPTHADPLVCQPTATNPLTIP
mmetsp:Transcript_13952/g.19361  ORF Transcript_13952/g.19361 Transcript_13952/m.19361 type:complete len:116 (+) Transcript_13952:1300-1647(+)